MMRALPFLAAVVGLSLAAGFAHADIPGDYTTTQRMDGGNIKYTLALRDNGDAELTAERSGSPSTDRESVRDYGRILRYLNDSRKVSHTGRWVRRGESGEVFSAELDVLDAGADRHRVSTTLSGSVDRDRLRLQRWDQALYGERTQFEFSRVDGGRPSGFPDSGSGRPRGFPDSGGSRRPSLAVPPGGSGSIRELNFTSRGSGTTRVGEAVADNLRLRDVRVRLDRSGDAEVEFRTHDGARQLLQGTWRDSGRSQGSERLLVLDLRSGSGLLTVRSGSGEVYLRSTGEVDRVNFRGVRGDHEAGQKFEFAFQSRRARG